MSGVRETADAWLGVMFWSPPAKPVRGNWNVFEEPDGKLGASELAMLNGVAPDDQVDAEQNSRSAMGRNCNTDTFEAMGCDLPEEAAIPHVGSPTKSRPADCPGIPGTASRSRTSARPVVVHCRAGPCGHAS